MYDYSDYHQFWKQLNNKFVLQKRYKKSVNRVLPQLKVDLQTVLATNKTLFDGYTQTLEPHAQYLYRPYKDQSNIGSKLVNDYLGFGYDSALVQQDYYSLFRDRRY